MNVIFIALASVALSVAAQFTLKAGMSSAAVKTAMEQPFSIATLLDILTNRLVFAGFSLYGIGAVVWLAVLARWDVSKAYPLVGVGFALSAVIGVLMGEQISMVRAVGISMICFGVLLVGRS